MGSYKNYKTFIINNITKMIFFKTIKNKFCQKIKKTYICRN